MLPNPEAQPTISVDQAGEILGISRSSAYQAARTGEIPTIRIGRRLVVPTAALLRLLDLEQPSPAGPDGELGACGATARHPSYGVRTCVLPAGHQPSPGRPPTSTDGWHESTDHIRWANEAEG